MQAQRRHLFAVFPLALLLLPLLLPPDGQERGGWIQFIGGFHPLLVHFPIALILLVALLEFAGRGSQRNSLRDSVKFILGFTLLCAVAAPVMGWSLSWGGGYAGDLVVRHMWAGTIVPISIALCLMLRNKEPNRIYVLSLCVAVALVLWTGFMGGQLTHGKSHLTTHAPEVVRNLLGIDLQQESLPADPDTMYGGLVAPILSARCISCHGSKKQKAALRLDSFDYILEGGKHGAVIAAGSADKSEIYRRITLPKDHDDFMPGEGKRPLTDSEIRMLGIWIDAGASATLALATVAGAAEAAMSLPTPDVEFSEVTEEAVRASREKAAVAVAEFQQRFPFTLTYVSRSSANLEINAAMAKREFADDDIKYLEPFLDHIVRADFSNTSITDISADILLRMQNLDFLNLKNTAIGDATIAALAKLPSLRSLNLLATDVTARSRYSLSAMPALENIYFSESGPSHAVGINPQCNCIYLSDLAPNDVNNILGGLQPDRVYWQSKIWMMDRRFEKGLGMHAQEGGIGSATYTIPNGSTSFLASIGMAREGDDPVCPGGSARFRVLVDDAVLYPWRQITFDLIDEVEIPLSENMRQLQLQVDDAGDGQTCDHSTWGDARFEFSLTPVAHAREQHDAVNLSSN